MKKLKYCQMFEIIGLLGCCFLFVSTLAFCQESQVWDGMSPTQVNLWVDEEIKIISESPEKLTPVQLQWGEKQLRQMLVDRPAMAPYVKEGDDLWNWTVCQFAGEVSHVEVQWDNSWPEQKNADRDAGTYLGPPDTKTHINVTENYMGTGTLIDQAELKGKPKDGQMLWYQTIFELFNSRKVSRFIKVARRGLRGDINRETFIVEMDMVEQDTRNQAYQFYRERWIPHCQKLSLPYQDSVLEKQLNGYGENFYYCPEDRINDLMTLKESDDHYKAYGGVYDAMIVPFVLKK